MNCPNCGKELQEGAKFCPDCGSEIDVRQAETVNTVAEEVETVEKETVDAAAKTEELSSAPAQEQPAPARQTPMNTVASVEGAQHNNLSALPTKKKSKKKLIVLIGVCFIFICVIIGLIAGTGSKSDNRADTVSIDNDYGYGKIAFNMTLEEYLEKLDSYKMKELQLDHPGEEESYYSTSMEMFRYGRDKAKTSQTEDGAIVYQWIDSFASDMNNVFGNNAKNYANGFGYKSLENETGYSIFYDKETGLVLEIAIVYGKNSSAEHMSNHILLCLMPVYDEDPASLISEAAQNGFAYRDGISMSIGENDDGLTGCTIVAMTKDNYKKFESERNGRGNN